MFEQGSEFAAQAIQETRAEARRGVARIEQLLRGLAVTDARAAVELRREILDFLANSPEAAPRGRGFAPDNLVHLSVARHGGESVAERAPEIEVHIMDILDDQARGMHIDVLLEHLEDFVTGISKGNLSVRLHRMVKAGRLMSTARGFYALSLIERARRPQPEEE